MNAKKWTLLITLGVIVVALAIVAQLKPPSIPALPTQYDLDALNSVVGKQRPPTRPVSLEEHRDYLLTQMREYMATGSATYNESHVTECGEILSQFIIKIRSKEVAANPSAILSAVKSAVQSLNKLNDSCDQSLIETMEREQLIDMFAFGAREANCPPEILSRSDITLPERNW